MTNNDLTDTEKAILADEELWEKVQKRMRDPRPGVPWSTYKANRKHLDEWRDHEWWPAIKGIHGQLTGLFPDYTISQIKEKFGGLSYYWAAGLTGDDDGNYPAYAAVQAGESWVYGYEDAKQRIVGWLRAEADKNKVSDFATVARSLADRIEKGEHHSTQ